MSQKIQDLREKLDELKRRVALAIALEKRLAKMLLSTEESGAPIQEAHQRQKQTTEQLKETLRAVSRELEIELAMLKPN
jgi:hypothetical protein